VKANTVPELIALARSKPGGLNVAAGGVGASHHLAA
jgi:tripartite-type tricarboxylate transporter receptor subunit TctC